MSSETTELKGGWQVEIDKDDPCGSFILARADRRFFRVVFNGKKYGQPVLEESVDARGFAGFVIAIVKFVDDVWHVVVTENERPANDYEKPLVEGARRSISNTSPFLTAEGEDVVTFPGFVYTNSARIAGKVKMGVVDVSDEKDFQLPDGARLMPIRRFFDQSTDSMTKACLGHFMVSYLKLL